MIETRGPADLTSVFDEHLGIIAGGEITTNSDPFELKRSWAVER